MIVRSVIGEAKTALNDQLAALEKEADADVLTIIGAIRGGLDNSVRIALESVADRRRRLAVVLHTVGGLVEVAERMVHTMRHFYPDEVMFIVPDVALSAGTVLAMSGDSIWMDYYGCLGPIDPQLEREGKFVPALSYLVQWDRLVKKGEDGTLTNAEFLIMKGFDLAELHQFELARDLSISLLKEWLTKYKLKDWKVTKGRGVEVTPEMRVTRARQIAATLMQHDLWGSHGRGIPAETLRDVVNVHIDDLASRPELHAAIRSYFELATDAVVQFKFPGFVHTRGYI